MTEKELNALHYLNIEIAELENEIAKLELGDYRSPHITGLPSGSSIGDPVGMIATELSERKMLLNLAYARAEIERNRLERFIASVDDAEMRLIIRLRHVKSYSWERIGAEIHADRRTASRKYYRFLKMPTMPTKDIV